MLQLYFRDAIEEEYCEDFAGVMFDYPQIHFYQPSPDKAPWHVQAKLDAADGVPIVMNFWPHKQKAQRQGEYSLEGPTAARDVIHDALEDQARIEQDAAAFDVIED